MRAMMHSLIDLAGKWLLPTPPLAHSARRDVRPAQTCTDLKHRLMSVGITQSQFADLCGIHRNTVSAWCNGRARTNQAALLVLKVLEADQAAARYVAGGREKSRPRGKPFAQGNPYRFGDKRRAVYVAGAQYARAAA